MATVDVVFDDGTVRTIDESDLTGSDGFGYADPVTVKSTSFDFRFIGEGAWAVIQHGQALYRGFSTTSLTIGTGSKSFSAETSMKHRPWFVGAWARAVDRGNSSNFMVGEITSYDASTGAMTLDVKRTGGSGTIADWEIKSVGEAGNLALGGHSFPYAFDTSTSNADPGSGNLRADNSDLTSATELYVDDETADGINIEAALLTFDDSTSSVTGQLQLVNRYDPADFVVFDVTGLTNNSGYVTLSVTHIAGSGSSPFANGQDIILGFARTGDKGDKGDPGTSNFDWIIKSSNYTASKDDRILADTSGGSFTITLPASPTTQVSIWIADFADTWNSNTLTVDGNGTNIEGASTFTADVDGGSFELAYNGNEWKVRYVGNP